LFKAFELIEVPVAVLTYFIYPLLTGLAAAAAGVER
jgi:probable blue pigment (indigoidine) exporter